MKHATRLLVVIAIAILAMGCARLKGKPANQARAVHPTSTEELQDMNLEALRGMMQNLQHEIAAMNALPPTPYPIYNQLRDTDLAGLKARLEMLTLLRDHCLLSKELVIRVKKDPSQKAQVLEEWEQHKERMAVVLDEADKKVNGLERKRIRLEFELIEATLKQK
jgi:hypothetical protein